MSLSQWCAMTEPIKGQQSQGPGLPWVDIDLDQHGWCRDQRWHDDYHGRDPGCCASPEEQESWACTCDCHLADEATS